MANRKEIAAESVKTKRAREKLKKHLDEIEGKITPQALEKKAYEIHRWIARHAPQRVVLRNKNISLFDENKNTAAVSRRVADIMAQVKQEFHVA